MGRQLALRAEIVHCFDNPGPKTHLPESVNGNPRSEWVPWADQPTRESQTVIRPSGLHSRQHRWNATLHFLSTSLVRSATEDVCRTRFRQFLHHHHRRDGSVEFSFPMLKIA